MPLPQQSPSDSADSQSSHKQRVQKRKKGGKGGGGGGAGSASNSISSTRPKKKSWSLEAKNRKTDGKSRQQIKEMLLAKTPSKEEDIDAPPNSDAKDESLRIYEQHMSMPSNEQYVMKQPQIAIKRKVNKKKGPRRAETLRPTRRKRNDSESASRKARDESSRTSNNSLFKERASANNSNANSPDNSEQQREARRRQARQFPRNRMMESSTSGISGPSESEGDLPLALALSPSSPGTPSRQKMNSSQMQQLQQASSMMQQLQLQQDRDHNDRHMQNEHAEDLKTARLRMSQPRGIRSNSIQPTPAQMQKPKLQQRNSEESTQLALEPEPDLDRVRRQKEAVFMKRFLTALKLLPKTPAPRAVTPPPRSEDSPSDSSKKRRPPLRSSFHQQQSAMQQLQQHKSAVHPPSQMTLQQLQLKQQTGGGSKSQQLQPTGSLMQQPSPGASAAQQLSRSGWNSGNSQINNNNNSIQKRGSQ